MKEIFDAKKLFDAYLIISEDSIVVDTIGVSIKYKGLYNSLIISSDFLFSLPITTRSGLIKSLIAEPSLKNSGLETTSTNLFLIFDLKIFSNLSPVVTGTVDLVIIILYLFINFLICFAT